MQMCDTERHRYLCQLALGPLRLANTWPMHTVNGYKFHTEAWNEDRKTYNCGVCAKGTGEGGIENDFYGILKDVVEIEYPGEPIKKCVLFSCHWFDNTPNSGTRVHKDFGIVEIRHTRRYRKYDPFIFADFATQVYYVPYPVRRRDNQDWWVVIKTTPRSRVDSKYTLQRAYQEEIMSDATTILDDVQIDNLGDDGYEEVDIDVTLMIHQNEEDAEGEEDEEEEKEEEEEEFADEDDTEVEDDVELEGDEDDEDDNE